jgi:hypothetical protein
MNKFLRYGICVFALSVSPSIMAANGPSWNYVSLGLVASGDLEIESFVDEGISGHRLEVAKSLGDMWLFRAVVNANQIDAGFGDVDMDAGTQQWGFGARFPVATRTDLWGSVNWERYTLEGIVGTGPGIDLGVRSQITEAVDLGLTLKVLGDISFDGDLEGDYTGYELMAAYAVTPATAVNFSFSSFTLDLEGDEIEFKNVVNLGLRFRF